MRTFVFTDDKSNKFWHIDLRGAAFTVTFGKVGTKGQTQVKDFPDEDTAQKAHDKLVAEKVGKGYVETTASAVPPASPLQQALEDALVENPDDVATHSAYADYLMEQGDPRGEFVQAQLALEDVSWSAAERAQLQRHADELMSQHSKQWMGDVGRFLVGDWSGEDKPYHFQFRRGWLDLVRVLPNPDVVIASLAKAPQARLLRRLEVVYDMRYHPFDFDQFAEGLNEVLREDEEQIEIQSFYMAEDATILRPLLESPYLTNLRVLELGFSATVDPLSYSTQVSPFGNCNVQQVIELLEKCPRLEELYLNTGLSDIDRLFALPTLDHLRTLQYYYGSDYWGNTQGSAYPLAALAGNVSLRRLTTLRLHAGRSTRIDIEQMNAVLHSPNLPNLTHVQIHTIDRGDEGCRRIIASGILRRLKTLDVGYGNMTDEGARLLAACPDLKHLDSLDVSRNALTVDGIAALRATGIRVVADEQHGTDEDDDVYDSDVE